jgi:predicted esterase
MILVLHDSGEKSKRYIDYWYDYAKKTNYLVLAPNSLKKEGWGKNDEERIKRIVGVVARDYGKKKILLNGVSAGGYYALFLAINNPGRFDALCNFQGLVISSLSPEIKTLSEGQKTLPILLVHGMLSEEVSTKYARLDVQRIREKGYDVIYWEISSPQGQVNFDILKWFGEVISP